MLKLPKFNKGMKQALTKLEKASKAIVSAVLVLGISSTVLPSNEAHGALVTPAIKYEQGAMVLAPSTNVPLMIARHYSHSSHSSHYSHSSHSSHYSHYSSRY